MKFTYYKQPNPAAPTGPWVKMPYIPVRLFYGKNHVDLLALVDSGAQISLFHSSVGKLLGIDVERGKKQKVYGISGIIEAAYERTIRIQMKGAAASVELNVWFTNAGGVKAILGQADFFEQHRITFERAKERIEIVPAK